MGDSAGTRVGDRVREFTAPLARPDGTTEEVALDALTAEKPVVLVFHPAGFDLRALAGNDPVREFEWFAFDDRVRVVAVSRARPRTHHELIAHLDLDYPFYTDRKLSIAGDFGLRYRAFGVAPRSRRACFLVDADRRIRYRWVDGGDIRTGALPDLTRLYEVLRDVIGEPERETLGFA